MSWCPVSSIFLVISMWTLQPQWLRAGFKPVLLGPFPVLAEIGTNLESFAKTNILLKEINILLSAFIQRSEKIMSKESERHFSWLLHQNLKQLSVCRNHPVSYQDLKDQIFHPERCLSGTEKFIPRSENIFCPFLLVSPFLSLSGEWFSCAGCPFAQYEYATLKEK